MSSVIAESVAPSRRCDVLTMQVARSRSPRRNHVSMPSSPSGMYRCWPCSSRTWKRFESARCAAQMAAARLSLAVNMNATLASPPALW